MGTGMEEDTGVKNTSAPQFPSQHPYCSSVPD